MKKTKGIFIAIIALFSLVVSACNLSADKQDELNKIKTSGVLNIGIEPAYPPFNYYNDKNQIIGFDVDISKEIAKRMGVKTNFVVTPWDSIIAGLLSQKYDVVISSMVITPERQKKVDFTIPYYHTGTQLVVPNNSSITDPTKIKGRKIGVTLGAVSEQKAREFGANVITYKGDLIALQDMQAGRLEGVIAYTAVGANYIKTRGAAFKMLGKSLYQSAVGISLNKNQEALRTEINKVLNEMFKDGTYAKISKKWFGMDIR